ncbi:cysteine-rich CWC family protein [Schlegelella aquatica]|uniref:cysteine-rich CWC family protein n=1 Tax=Caldimonas aquatica TaxID=376175 RepID=UPI0037526EEF
MNGTEATPGAPTPIDPTRCPLCGGPNGCAMAGSCDTAGACGPCWCSEVRFSAELLDRVPAHAQRRACICRDCATRGTA